MNQLKPLLQDPSIASSLQADLRAASAAQPFDLEGNFLRFQAAIGAVPLVAEVASAAAPSGATTNLGSMSGEIVGGVPGGVWGGSYLGLGGVIGAVGIAGALLAVGVFGQEGASLRENSLSPEVSTATGSGEEPASARPESAREGIAPASMDQSVTPPAESGDPRAVQEQRVVRPQLGVSSSLAREEGPIRGLAEELAELRALKALLSTAPGAVLEGIEQSPFRVDGVLHQERASLAIDALVRLGNTEQVKIQATRFLALYPNAPAAERLRTLAK